ncbi:hypothetical protein E3220_18060 (plasmid) [Piscirickettsia salmonis]|nr:hypothetical protein E3220_18060 [Piscirickettsia salmonis]
MLEFLSHNCKEKASFFLIVFFNLLIVCQKLLIERYTSPSVSFSGYCRYIPIVSHYLRDNYCLVFIKQRIL